MVKRLIIANVAVFIFQIMLGSTSARQSQFIKFFGLVPAFVFSKFMLWQFFTYMFLHHLIYISHIFFNMFVLWMFGGDLEREWGGRKFLRYYLITGIGAGFIYYLSAVNSTTPTIGASGAIFGILVAFGMTFPERIVLVFFILPMKAKHAVMLFGAIELLLYLSLADTGGVSRFAHLGGVLIGYLYLRRERRGYEGIPWWSDLSFRFNQWRIRQRAKQKEAREKEEDIDAILDKISRWGMGSLTRRERRILQRKSKS